MEAEAITSDEKILVSLKRKNGDFWYKIREYCSVNAILPVQNSTTFFREDLQNLAEDGIRIDGFAYLEAIYRDVEQLMQETV